MREEVNMIVIRTHFEGRDAVTTHNEIALKADDGTEWNVVNLYPDAEYQELYGFGGAVTEAAAYVYAGLDAPARRQLIEAYYGQTGLGYGYGRCSVDSCDFGLGNYSAQESPDAPFSLQRDEKYILPMLADIYRTRRIGIFMAPWSPPAFMKTNGEKNRGGKLKREDYGQWAEYLCRYLLGYRARGIDVCAISAQNEPNATQPWDSCTYTAEEEGEFLGKYLYPAMLRNGLGDIRRIVWDHNKERVYERLKSVYDELEDKRAVCGVGYHWYSGDHFGALRLIGERYPHLLSVFTEGCVEYSGSKKSSVIRHAARYAHEIIGCLNNGCNLFLDWNILLDEAGGPNHKNNFCEAPVMTDGKGGLVFNPSYHVIGHFSRYLRRGARRIAVSSFSKDAEVTAWKNPDGGIAAVIFNASDRACPVHLRVNGKIAAIDCEANSICTCLL